MREDERHSKWPTDVSDAPQRSGLLGRFGSARFREAEEELEERTRDLAERAAKLASAAETLSERESAVAAAADALERRLRTEAVELDVRETALDELTSKLSRRETGLTIRESELEARRRQLGAVELQRAALERREEAVAAREREALVDTGRSRPEEAASHLLFVPGDGYSLTERAGPPPTPGGPIEIADAAYVVARLGASPLPGDRRQCAFLVEA